MEGGERNLPWGPRRGEVLMEMWLQSLEEDGPGEREEVEGEMGESPGVTLSAIHWRT